MITADYQSLEPGNKVRLIEVDGSTFGVDDVLRFHAYNLPHTEEEIAAAPAELANKTEEDALVAYLQGLGTLIKTRN